MYGAARWQGQPCRCVHTAPACRPRHATCSASTAIPNVECAATTSAASYKIRGGQALHGTLTVSGSKNSALAVITASLLAASETTLHNVPNLQDVRSTVSILQSLGVRVQHETGPFDGTLTLDTSQLLAAHPPDSLVQQTRSSFLLVGPLLARLGSVSHVSIAQPGGCRLGSRPVDLHLHVLKSMGVCVRRHNDRFHFTLQGSLMGAHIHIGYPSVGATCMFLLTAAAARGPSTLENAAHEPEVQDLAHMLSCMGADIRGAGTSRLKVHPPARLHGCDCTIMPDRIEAGTFMAAAAATGSCLVVEPVVPAHMHAVIDTMQAAGCRVDLSPLHCAAGETPPGLWQQHRAVIEPQAGPLRAVDVFAEPFGGFPTDLQPQFTAVMAASGGSAVVTDTVFEDRMGHVRMLRAMGADIECRSKREVVVHGVGRRPVPQLRGVAGLHAADLRAGAALVLAALAAEGESRIDNVGQISRGYAGMHAKLAGVGARIAMETQGRTTFVSETF
eukprot:jgi/Ulvmu1/457/UM001_0464.1